MLNEIKWKDFFADCALYIMSEQDNFKLNGEKEIVRIILEIKQIIGMEKVGV